MLTKKLLIPPALGRFIKSVMTLAGGIFIGQILLLLATPFLTALYGPLYFGQFALYVAWLSNLLVLMTGRYELAIVLPADQRRANDLMGLTISIALCMGVLMTFVLWSSRHLMAEWVHNTAMARWFFWMPFALTLVGMAEAYVQWNNRHKRDIDNALGRIVQVSVMVVVQFYCAQMGFLALGLLWGQLISQVAILLVYARRDLMQRLPWRRELTVANMRKAAVDYARFPCLTMPQSFFIALQETFTLTLIGVFAGSLMVGFFGLGVRVLRVPVTMLGNAIGLVAYRDMVALQHQQGDLASFFRKLWFALFMVSWPSALILWFFGPPLFVWVFGDAWHMAGVMASVLSPYLMFHFMLSPLTTVVYVLGKQKMAFGFTATGNLLFISSLVLGWFLWHNILSALYLVAITQSVFFTVYLLCLYWLTVNAGREIRPASH